ncbi:carbonic anhydrase family protein [Lelliottia sp. SL45]|uniref:carbonic anhydrase n=1 Tax=Lelliottia sp. SL45 TaxID=2994665 RepID=UPI0022736487|nr:carbonic anhydrase family protein [Lelliottia sp. SL45]MCY1700950.1 carbonic anhydrase family protein [Lelliottia sp. SL45]
MKNQVNILYKPSSFFLLLCLSSSSIATSHHEPHWGYEGESGPAYWGELSEDYKLCKKGMKQSPINITQTVTQKSLPATLNFSLVEQTIQNNGHTIQVSAPGGSSVALNEQQFKLVQFHVHTPSENTIEGQPFPLEFHFVHKNEEGRLAVVAVMVKEGLSNSAIAGLIENAPSDAGQSASIDERISVESLFPFFKDYYSYEGSLTTPPCSEDVKWLVMKSPVTASASQIFSLNEIIGHSNNRPVQQLNDRVIFESN